MKHLLERWSQLEPDICEDLYGQTIRLHMSDDSTYSIYPLVDELPIKELAMIQWAIQQAIIEKGWYLEMYYTPSTYHEAIVINPSKAKDKAYSQNSMAEALLTAYLKALDA